MTQAQIQELFKQRYSQANWRKFIAENFAGAQLLASPKTLTAINAEVAVQALQLGQVMLTGESFERTIAVYEVTLAPGIVLERNRVGLRNLLRKYWKEIDGAFIVYHRPGELNWRFTYVSELTGWDEEGEQIKIKTEPKRYTYVLGEGESVRTAAERFNILAAKGGSATLDHVKDAFSVEKLSKAFFDEYKQHYQEICQYLVNSGFSKSVFNGNEKGIRDFSKKLLGRIVFLYFIQKKGWLGVAKDAAWGTGDKAYLSRLFEQAKHKELFYQEYLSKLFFDTLNAHRPPLDLIELVKGQPCRIPFLNGGLFEEEDKKHRNLVFEKSLFANLFNFFNQYNFTIYEDDPNDHTVAVDPEMLGHIFENLLEDNKDKGAFYTPKEIVHYMCQESLIEYLTTWFENKGYEITGYAGLDKPDQAQLFPVNEGRKGQLKIEVPAQTAANRRIDRSLIEKLLKKQLEDTDKALVLKHRAEFETALDTVKICDPAIGSGAFPMGLLHEIFTAKQTLYAFANGNTQGFDASGVKLNIIQNSIYGVDIESGAVDIARLRFWLSLIVDEPEPKALPNLDYKIVVGNSLVSKLGDDIIDINWETKGGTQNNTASVEYIENRGKILAEISREQKQFFKPESDKKKLALNIRNLKIDLLINQLALMVKETNLEYEPKRLSFKDAKKYNLAYELYLQTQGWKKHIANLEKLKTKPDETLHFFDWKLDFPEVMNEQVAKGNVGFDIVIANPPYIDSETMVNTGNEDLRIYLSNKLNFCKGNWDIYIAFFELSFNLLNDKGNLVFITPDKWISKPFGDELRIGLRNNIYSIAEAGRKVFDNAKVDSIITFISRKTKPTIRIDKFYNGKADNFSVVDKTSLLEPYPLDWLFSDYVEKINSIDRFPNKVIDFAECENACATSDAYKIKDYIINIDSDKFNPAKLLKIINTGTIGRYNSKWGFREMTYLKDKYLSPVVDKNEFLKDFTNTYGAKSVLPKIIIKGLTLLDGCLDKDGLIIPGKSTLVITKPRNRVDELYFPLALINSKLSLFYIKEKYRGSSYNQGINFNPNMINNLPVPNISKRFAEKINALVLTIISNKIIGEETINLEQEIDNLIFKLYDLTYEEVKVIDPEFPLTEAEYAAIEVDVSPVSGQPALRNEPALATPTPVKAPSRRKGHYKTGDPIEKIDWSID